MENSKNKKTGGVLFIDLKAAFDTVPHDILLELIERNNVFSDLEKYGLLRYLLKNA